MDNEINNKRLHSSKLTRIVWQVRKVLWRIQKILWQVRKVLICICTSIKR